MRVTFGKTGLEVSRLAIGSSYGVGGDDLVWAFDRGVNFFFWGLRRTSHFADGLRALAPKHRSEMVIAIQSYSRSALLMRRWVDCALSRLKTDYVDVLTLGWWNSMPPARILDEARALREKGKVRHLMISSHDRPTFAELVKEPAFEAIMVRYNAAHPGAEREVFPLLDAAGDPGVLAFTVTRWGTLLNPRFTPEGEPTPTSTDCYRFVLSSPHVDVSLCGPKDRSELELAMRALDHERMSEDELAWMRRVGKAVHASPAGESPVNKIDRLLKRFKRSQPKPDAATNAAE
ncbi:MAG: aldo/keto reductase [Polyangiaceae bacterium]